VLVDDNYHYMDESERYERGVYVTAEAAVAVCKAIVESSLRDQLAPGLSAAQLYWRYENFGADPFIVATGDDEDTVKFSAWSYAKQRCHKLLKNSGDNTKSK
jgi:hypothetical protein